TKSKPKVKENSSAILRLSKTIFPALRILFAFSSLGIMSYLAYRSFSASMVVEKVEASETVLSPQDYDSREILYVNNGITFNLKVPDTNEIARAKIKYKNKLEKIRKEKERIEQE